MITYRTEIIGTRCGKGATGMACVRIGNTWRAIGETSTKWTYPVNARARLGAENICLDYHARMHACEPYELTKA